MSGRIKLFAVAVILFGVPGSSFAQISSLQIDGPHEVSTGQLVRLRSQLGPAESPFWIVLQPTDLDYEQVNGGSQLIFAANCSQQKPITILLLAQSVVKGRIVTRQLRRTITVKGKVSPIDGGKQPVPKPNLDFVKSPLFATVQTAWQKIGAEAARRKTNAVATNFETIAAACRSGSIESVPMIWQQLSPMNRSTLGEQAVQWEPVGIAIQQSFQKLELSNVSEHSFHFQAIAAALRSLQ